MPLRRRFTASDHWKLERAIAMVRKGFSLRSVAHLYGFAASTLHSKLKRPPEHNHPGKPTILSEEDENRIVDFIFRSAKAGFPTDTKRLRISVGQYMQLCGRTTAFRNGTPGRKWMQLFLKRHPEVSRRIPSALSKQRTHVTEAQIRKWFNEVSTYICDEKLQNVLRNPDSVFNLDETSMHLVPMKESVLAKRGEKYVHTANANSEKETFTALFCANAAGVLAPPLILFPYKMRLPAAIVYSMPNGWSAGKSESGWMTQETFYYYLKNVFYPWLVKCNASFPVIVFLDGHKSHVCYQTIEFCREHGIILICLYPNSTHVLQPLDVSFFRGLKVRWNKRLIDWRTNRGGEALTRTEYGPLLKQAVDDIDNISNTLQNGFRKCGLLPFDPDAVNYGMLLQQDDRRSKDETPTVPASYTKDQIERASIALNVMESFLTKAQRRIFEENEKTISWTGPTIDINLFHVWKHIKTMANATLPLPDTVNRDQDSFYGFEESEILADHQNHLTKFMQFDQGPSKQNLPGSSGSHTMSTDESPNTALVEISTNTELVSASTESVNHMPNDDQNDFFNKAFRIPSNTKGTTHSTRRTFHSRLPVVASSDEYKKYYERLEAEKQMKEKNKAAKKAIRSAKKTKLPR